ncbi:D-methionine transport system permease protein [[Eubacterium] yurii]|jgi:metal ion ABC superfamily ATP binding cassette transporter, membrane protein|nr:D-methionine transport system permease protein [[Eubacterium] yurii]
MISKINEDLIRYGPSLVKAFKDTCIMVGISGLFATILGTPIGIILAVTGEDGLMKNKILNSVLSKIINILRSIPFVILVASIPWLVRAIVHTTIGVKGAVIPLIIASSPFMAKQVELALLKVDKGVIEAYTAMGFSKFDIIIKVLLREGLGGIVQGITLSLVGLIGYSAIAGTVGGGGLGDFAIRYGYNMFNPHLMTLTLVIIIILVFFVQFIGDDIYRRLSHN